MPVRYGPSVSRFVEVAVQLPVHGTFHYSVPEAGRGVGLVGRRVLVPFGSRGVTGIVVGESETVPGEVEVRDVEALLDAAPALSGELIELCRWIASYYEAPLGEVVRAALPAGTRVGAASRIELTEEGRGALDGALDGSGSALARSQREVLAALAETGGNLAAGEVPGGRRAAKVIEELAATGWVRQVRDVQRARVRDRTVKVAVLVRRPDERETAELARAPAQRAVLDALVGAGGQAEVAVLRAAHRQAASLLRALAGRGLVELHDKVVRGDVWAGRAEAGHVAPVVAPTPSAGQARALAALRAGLAEGEYRGYLLHGITGSGKTEVYLQIIADALAAGRGALVLVPEISLTPQLSARFRARFGDRVAVLHSGLSDRERFDEWSRLREGAAQIALGARSAVFAPLADLAVVVVDEEHDSSFKQEEGVRYHARDVALVRAQRARALCVLGSATPSLESYHGAENGRLTLLALGERATARPLPAVELVDLRVHQADPDSMLTAPLCQAVAETLARGEQAILFLNRRGFHTFVLCVKCGHPFRCRSCSVSLTYHRQLDRLLCHYCGHSERIATRCPACSATGSIARRGLGTERVADGLERAFPAARIARLDRDAVAGVAIDRVLGRMARGEVDLLVGTQMVAKGHDFPGVTLVGVLLADTGLSLPDFRAGEKTFQLLTQVAGRAGRGERPGRVIIQSYRTDSIAVAAAREHDYLRFYRTELEARRELDYPPFGHLAAVRLDGPDGSDVAAEAKRLAERARELGGGSPRCGVAVLGPAEAPLARLKGRTRWHMWLRARERRELRGFLRSLVPGSRSGARSGSVRVTVDVDPVSAL
jgi:primosomal protein N' (replication factor Y)